MKTSAAKLFIGLFCTYALVVAPNIQAKVCNNELRREGNVSLVDLNLGQVTINFNLFDTNQNTEYKGNANSLNDIGVGDFLEVRYCIVGSQALAHRIDKQSGGNPPNGQIIDLDVPPGTESVPVTRVYGDDSGGLGGYNGRGLAFGDFNGDGYDDMVVSPGVSGVDFSDAVVIVYGSGAIPGFSVDLNSNGTVSVNGETRILASATFQGVGLPLAAGDVDNDGIDDALITEANGVRVVFGRPNLPATAVTLAPAPSADETVIRVDGRPIGLGSGDVNADGFADIIFGVPGRPFVSGDTVFIVYGGQGLRGATVNLEGSDISLWGETRVLASIDSRLGSSVASGDVNGDGITDAIIGAVGKATFNDEGAVIVLYGSAALPGTIVDLSITPATGPLVETRIRGNRNNAHLDNVASCDVNGDGFADVIAGAPGITGPGDNFRVGEVYVFYGSPTLPGRTNILGSTVAPDQTWVTGREEFGGLADAVVCSDVNGDGFGDLVMGARGAVPFGSLPETNQVEDGAVYVLHGGPNLLGQQFIDIRDFADVLVFADNADDRLGSGVAAGGDLDRNGIPEYLASASGGDNPSILPANNSSGYAVAVFGETASLSATRILHSISGNAPPTDFGPVGRMEVDFVTGISTSTETVTITRSAPATLPTGIGTSLPVQWNVSSDRGNFSADLTFAYTDTELGALDETLLEVYTSPGGTAGSWTVAGVSVARDALRNTITVTGVTEPGSLRHCGGEWFQRAARRTNLCVRRRGRRLGARVQREQQCRRVSQFYG